jgi:hypothetical protein
VFVVLNAMPLTHVDRGGGVGAGAQQISGPSWSLPATPVRRTAAHRPNPVVARRQRVVAWCSRAAAPGE